MARLRKLIDSDSDNESKTSLPDIRDILKTPATRKPVSRETSRLPSTSLLFTDEKKRATKIGNVSSLTKHKAESKAVKSADLVAVKESSGTATRKQRALKPLKQSDALLNKVPIQELRTEKKTPRRREGWTNSIVKAQTSSQASIEKSEDSGRNSDTAKRRRAQRSLIKRNYSEPIDPVDGKEESVVIEESVVCGSDISEDSFICDSDDDTEEESVNEEWTDVDRKSTRWTDLYGGSEVSTRTSTSRKIKEEASAKRSTETFSFADFKLPTRPAFRSIGPKSTATARPSSSSDSDQKAILKFSPKHSRSPRKEPPSTNRPVTPPPTQSTRGRLTSPSKPRIRVPTPPHTRPSLDGFWDPQAVNEWHDAHSPQKPLLSPTKGLRFLLHRSKPESESSLPSSPTTSPITSPKKRSSPQKKVLNARHAFEARKHSLAEDFLAELDSTITKNRLSELSASAGGIKIIWTNKLNSTAGRANWRRETMRMRSPDNTTLTTREMHHASIELASKVIDNDERLHNVLAHEFCHLANFMVSKVTGEPHGASFKAWARQVSARFADRGVHVTTKHSYAIAYKYIWACMNCSQEYKRHSKSVDPTRHSCGVCKGSLVQIQPVPRKGAEGNPSEYQLFVKENFQRVKKECEGKGHAVVMETLGRLYREKKEKKAANVTRNDTRPLEDMLGGLNLGKLGK